MPEIAKSNHPFPHRLGYTQTERILSEEARELEEVEEEVAVAVEEEEEEPHQGVTSHSDLLHHRKEFSTQIPNKDPFLQYQEEVTRRDRGVEGTVENRRI
mmetsp:Transcript_25989/g.55659  ORF Transcript_25989/g.55659 Transcript_25989/m.55659 type:complete len:100 (-) Transcript_25989:2638-2937(-)